MKLTFSQKEAVVKFQAFLKSTATFGTLSGLGGTGKTTVVKEILVFEKDKNILYLAPTHKAKTILEKNVGVDCYTLASALGMRLNENTGKFVIDKKSKKSIHKYKIIVVDECSMISDEMFYLIKNNIKLLAKVIFLGDHNQLPPIGQSTDSLTFNYIIATLTERIRQGTNNPIIPLTDAIIENINNPSPLQYPGIIKKTEFNIETNSGVFFAKNLESLMNLWEVDFNISPELTKIITFNNEKHISPYSVGSVNKLCRTKLGFTADYEVGEILMAYDSFGEHLCTADEYKILSIEPKEWVEYAVVPESKWSKEKSQKLNLKGWKTKLLNINTKEIININLPNLFQKQYIFNKVKELFEKKDFAFGYALLETIPNLEYGYALTATKSQGSTYRNVFVLTDNILNQFNGTNRSRNQAFYVACSRPTHNLTLL